MLASQNLPRFSAISAFTKACAGKSLTFYAYWANRYLTFSKRLKNADAAEALRLFLEDLQSRENIADWQIQQAKRPFSSTAIIFTAEKRPGLMKPDAKSALAPFGKGFGKVSASTQNQAFNALLFLFRNVLKIEIGDLQQHHTGKAWTKLPVVLTIEEMQQLFSYMEGRQRSSAQGMLRGRPSPYQSWPVCGSKDIDFGSGLILVRNWAWRVCFPSSKLSVDPRSGIVRRHHMVETSIKKAVGTATRKAGIARSRRPFTRCVTVSPRISS